MVLIRYSIFKSVFYSNNYSRGNSCVVQVVLGVFANGQLNTWNFKSGEIVRETNLEVAPSFTEINRHR